MSPRDYEQFCCRELRAIGWDAHTQGGSGDQGVDVVARHGATTLVVQCKLYSGSVGNGAVQEIHTGRLFHRAEMAAVVSNAAFTPGARAAAQQAGVVLLHHTQLRSLLPPEGSMAKESPPPLPPTA
jgi:HJR/Mrr/RecB family endonuclease